MSAALYENDHMRWAIYWGFERHADASPDATFVTQNQLAANVAQIDEDDEEEEDDRGVAFSVFVVETDSLRDDRNPIIV